MNHIKKFEELDYSTYISASDKLKSHGQRTKSDVMKSHASDMEKRKIDLMKFDILIGETKAIPDAKYKGIQIIREKTSTSLLFIFESSVNTHRISSTIDADGSIFWKDYNKFANRKSVNNFERLIGILSLSSPELIKLLRDMNIDGSNLNILQRTFYV